MTKNLKFHDIIDNLIGEINEAKRRSTSIHNAGNISSSGDEIEDLIRDKISLFLPEKYLVRQGHIINSEGQVSNQFDIIIFDRLNTPKFFETKNNTVFYPIESVLAVGEIKKTLRGKDIVEFAKKIKFLKIDMKRKLIENPVFGGKISPGITISDIVNMGVDRKYKNPLFSFIVSIDVENTNELHVHADGKFMPNDIYILNHGVYLFGKLENGRIVPQIEDENTRFDHLIEIKKPGIVCLTSLFSQLINHLNKCHIEAFGISDYMTDKDVYEITGADVKAYTIKKQ